ncbi:protein kinase subdomain-containing protein PKL [Mycena metata]|uniref:Protein kinase subdomain-containing protein PKL n=1 Tax=Mycena metata TaxID=1033252 RepID=A0AAD7ILA3_9AGAR|nr:protein kinase subdomain-containing protein PKL [Mycena metata]
MSQTQLRSSVLPRLRASSGFALSIPQTILRGILHLLPTRIKSFLYDLAARTSSTSGHQLYHNIFRLPFGLVLKTSQGPSPVEASALRLIASLRGINTPVLIDSVSTAHKTFLLTTWVAGDCCSDIWDDLTPLDKSTIVEQLRELLRAMREQTATLSHPICNASGSAIEDPRVPWLHKAPRVFSSCREFLEEVWIGLDFPRNRDTLRPLVRPLIDRIDIPIVFCHGDLLPKNVILPGGLEKWRQGRSTVCLIDWECAGWMPLSWEALKATWLSLDLDDEWLRMMKEVFQECSAELDADWQWRSRSRIAIV